MDGESCTGRSGTTVGSQARDSITVDANTSAARGRLRYGQNQARVENTSASASTAAVLATRERKSEAVVGWWLGRFEMPEDRIVSTNQHPGSMATQWSIPRGVCRVRWRVWGAAACPACVGCGGVSGVCGVRWRVRRSQ